MKLAILYQQSEPPAKDGIKEIVKIKRIVLPRHRL